MIKREDIIKVARLARLNIPDEEIDSITEEMKKIIEFANTVNDAVENDDLEDFDDINGIENAYHEDIIIESMDRELILKNRDGGEDGYFFIPKRMVK